jgi:hypothetical protein
MNFKKFKNIGDSEPRAWDTVMSKGTKFTEEDCEDDEVPAPYCDEFEDDDVCSEEETEETEETEEETETETESVSSRRKVSSKGHQVLHEETDFMQN